MKTTPFFACLLSTGALLAVPFAPAHAQSLRTDSAGNGNLLEDSLLNLGGPRLVGVLPPVRVGAGTPSTATFLRGDGVWAGMTPGGNTIPSAGGLLMGDGAGNAAAVASSTDLSRLLGARLELARAALALPINLLNNTVLAQGTVNVDGTLTVPPGGFVAWNLPGTAGPVYLYAAATTDQPVNALKIEAFYGTSNRTDSASTPLPGVVRSVTSSLAAGYTFQVRVTNATASPVTILYPVAATVDPGLGLIASQADFTPVAPPRVADLDFTPVGGGDRAGQFLAERQTTVAADSVGGSNASAGGLYAPRLTLQQTLANGSVFGLYRQGVFRESLPLSGLGNLHGMIVRDVGLGSGKPLPIVSGLDSIANSSLVADGSGAFACTWTPTDSAVANDGYSNVYVVEINTAMEAAQPVAARRRMTEAANEGIVDSTPGTACVSASAGTWTLFLHPSDNLAPGSGSYRYEVVSRVSPSGSWYPGNGFGDGSMSGLQLVGGSGGYGPLCGPTGFAGDRLVVQHATTHNAVLGGGSLSRSVFYEGGDDDAIMLAWYAADPTGLRWSMDRCLFYAGTRPTDMVISHSGGGQSYARGDIADCAFIGAGRINGALACVGIKYDNVSTGVIERCLVSGMRTLFGAVMPLSTEVRNNVFRQVQTCNIGLNFHDNIVAAEPAGVNYATANPCSFTQAGASATNNFFWSRGIANGFSNNDAANGMNFGGLNNCTCSRNVFVLDPASTTDPSTYFFPGSATISTLAIDYNLVINLGKGGFYAAGPGGGYTTWAAYQAGYPALDPHSLYVDLSADPRGLKAVFVDPANGDFRWAQTEVARRCAAFCRANNVGPRAVPSRWPVVPTVDDAVRALTNL